MRFLMLNWRDPQNPLAGGAERVTQAQALAVAGVAKASGAQVVDAIGGGARYPKAAKGSAANRRVELVCYQ